MPETASANQVTPTYYLNVGDTMVFHDVQPSGNVINGVDVNTEGVCFDDYPASAIGFPLATRVWASLVLSLVSPGNTYSVQFPVSGLYQISYAPTLDRH